jgi:glycosyltransferase involved in cell wall biosynthesis
LAAYLRRVNADVVHTHNPHPVIYGAPAARLARVPCVHTKHGANVASKRSSLLRRVTSRLSTVVVGVSAETARQACAQGEATKSRVQVIDNGINVEQYARDSAVGLSVRDELGIPRDAVVVGTVGRMVAAKNQVLLVRAMATLVSPSVHLVIVGDGPLRGDVESAREACEGKHYIHLLGRRLDVVRLLSAFDVFALSSDTEGLPMVLPESMACSLPIVATAVGGIPGVVNQGKDGFVVPPGDESALRDAIQTLVTDDALRETMGKAASESAAQRYSAYAMHAKYEALYVSLLPG